MTMASTSTTRVVVRMLKSGSRCVCCPNTAKDEESANTIARSRRLPVVKLMPRDLSQNSRLATVCSLPMCARLLLGMLSYRERRLHHHSARIIIDLATRSEEHTSEPSHANI